MGPLQLVCHVVQKHLAGEQGKHWDKTNKEYYHLRWCKLVVCLLPVRFLLTNKVFLYHVIDQLQSAHFWTLEQEQFSFESIWLIIDDYQKQCLMKEHMIKIFPCKWVIHMIAKAILNLDSVSALQTNKQTNKHINKSRHGKGCGAYPKEGPCSKIYGIYSGQSMHINGNE